MLDSLRRLLGFLRSGGMATAFACALLILLIVATIAWNKWGAAIIASDDYTLTAEKIEITPLPDWIRTDLKAEVVRDGSLGELKILDPEAADKVAQAFSLHSWVAKVRRVEKSYPAQVLVELEYRRPIAMVEVNDNGEPSLYPIDKESVFLSTRDFLPPLASQNEIRQYLRVSIGPAMPAGPVGTPWGDKRISDAARIAHLLQGKWQALGLYRIVSHQQSNHRHRTEPRTFELQTRSGARILWGAASDKESQSTAEEKLNRLEQFVAKHGSLSKLKAEATIDLRQKEPKIRTAQRQKSGA